jgi:hypothetical protein
MELHFLGYEVFKYSHFNKLRVIVTTFHYPHCSNCKSSCYLLASYCKDCLAKVVNLAIGMNQFLTYSKNGSSLLCKKQELLKQLN